MQIAAIVTIAGQVRGAKDANSPTSDPRGVPASQELLGTPTVFCDVLGRNIVERALDRMHGTGVQQVSVISESPDCDFHDYIVQSSNATVVGPGETFWTAWDRVVSQYLNQGVDLLLLARLGPYIELNIGDLVRFHRGVHSQLTQVYDGRGALDMVVVEAAPLRSGSGSIRSRLSALIPGRSRYRYHGYSNRLRDPIEYRGLVRDALLGRCDIQPVGSEIKPGIWAGANTRIDASARIEAPSYIGESTCIGASCRISQESVVERHCEVDAGTTVEDSCILAGTYVGMGLSVAHSVIAGSRLFHLHRNIELQLADGRLIGEATHRGLVPRGLLKKTASALLRREDKSSMAALSTRTSPEASLVTSSRWLGRFSGQG